MSSSISKPRAVAWAVWMVASIFYAYQYILKVMPNIMLSEIMEQFQINAATFGQFSGIYYIGYSLVHIPIGLMLDRFGLRRVMSGCILLSVLGMLPLLFAEHWVYPIIGRLLTGIGSSAAILGVFKIIRMTFKEKLFTRMLSISVTIGLLGAIYGGGPVSYLCETLGHLAVVKILAIIGIALAATTYVIVPNATTPSQNTVFADIKEVICNRGVIISCFCAGLMVGPLEGFADVWATAFLKQVYNFNGTVAASLPSLIFMGMCFGAPILSLIAERVGYLAAIVGSGALMAIGFITFLTWQLPSTLLMISFIAIGICCAYQILAIYKASTYVREHVVGLTTAIANMIIMIFGYAFHALIGAIINTVGGPQHSNALIAGMIVIPSALALGTAGFIFLLSKERLQKTIKEP